ncbi:MAG: VCBS repeat-containing protein, partial [Planctomycetota bacterium]
IASFLSSQYQGTLLVPPLLNSEAESVSWEISSELLLDGKPTAISAWEALAQPFSEGDIRFLITNSPSVATPIALTRILCTSKTLEYQGTLKISWIQENQDWKIQQVILVEMKTLTHRHPAWFTEIPFPIRGIAPDFHSVENKNLDYQHLYDLVLSGISTADYNGDGWLDIYFSQRGNNILLKNLGNGSFENVSDSAGVADSGDSRGASFADIDQDGDLDLFVCNFASSSFPQGNTFYRNIGDGTFKEATENVGLRFVGPCMNASWGDLDRDGDLDLFVSCYGDIEKKPYQFISKREEGTRNLLYINQGNGTFQEEGVLRNFSSKSWSYGAYIGDVNEDLLPDIYVLNEFGPNHFYLNQGNLQFEEVGIDFNLRNFLNSRSVVVHDLNGDAFPDFVLVNLHSSRAARFNPLFTNLQARKLKFQQSTQGTVLLLSTKSQVFKEDADSKISMSGSGYGCTLGEVTNDFQPYLYVTNGHYSSDTEIDMEDYEWRRFFLYQ